MSDDKVVNFPGTNGPEREVPEVSADEILMASMGKFEDVIIIGIGPGKAQCISTMPLQLAVYELSRAIHRIHDRSDLLP